MPAKKDAEYWKNYRAQKAQERIQRDNESGPQEVPAESGGPELTKDQVVGRPKKPKTIEAGTLADANMILASNENFRNLPPAAVEAILEGVRKGSPQPWRDYLEKRGKA